MQQSARSQARANAGVRVRRNGPQDCPICDRPGCNVRTLERIVLDGAVEPDPETVRQLSQARRACAGAKVDWRSRAFAAESRAALPTSRPAPIPTTPIFAPGWDRPTPAAPPRTSGLPPFTLPTPAGSRPPVPSRPPLAVPPSGGVGHHPRPDWGLEID